VLLRDAGERELELVERERHCIEALAAQQAGGIASDREAGGEVREAVLGRGTSKSETSGRQGERDREQRQRLEWLAETRSKLSSALHDLRNAAQQEHAEIQQLRTRNEALRKESDALRASTSAARERETQLRQKLEGLDTGAAFRQQRQQVLERKVVELRTEVQGLQTELVAAAKAPVCNPITAASLVNGVTNDEATWAANHLLEAKVTSLREQLRQRQAAALKS
jgi:chromosome segregation ATPase